jgi:hypothetical protein
MRKMGKELGDELSGPEFDQMVNDMEAGTCRMTLGRCADDFGGDGDPD